MSMLHDITGLALCVRQGDGQIDGQMDGQIDGQIDGQMDGQIDGHDNDISMNSYGDIVCIEAELSGYRRGCIRVRIDFDKKIVIWRDSLQWNNNFLRSISADKINFFRTRLPAAHILKWHTHYNGPVPQDNTNVCHPADWAVVISFSQNAPVRILGSMLYPCEWHLFRDLIESITKIPFRLR